MKRFWLADLHFGHANITKYCNRPTLRKTDLDENGNWVSQEVATEAANRMDSFLIKNCNGRVKAEDDVMCVGDFINYGAIKGVVGLRNKPKHYLDQLNGTWLLIMGNHDGNNGVKHAPYFIVVSIGQYKAFVAHYPIENDKIFNPRLVNYVINCTDFQITGHVHGAWKYKYYSHSYGTYLMYNVGIDVHRYMPITDSEIIGDVSKLLAI